MKSPVTAEDVKAQWGKHLQRKREALGMTQVQLAVKLGRDTSTVSRAERGIGPLESFLELAGALGVQLINLPEAGK